MSTETTNPKQRMKRYREFRTPGDCSNCGDNCVTPAGRSFVWVYYPENDPAQAELQGYCSPKCRAEWRARNT